MTIKNDDDSTSAEATTNHDSDTEEDSQVLDDLNKPTQYLVIQDYQNNQNGFLKISKGEIITVIDKMSEHWWRAENVSNVVGLVPVNLLRLKSSREDIKIDPQHNRRSGLDLWSGLKKMIHQEKAFACEQSFLKGCQPSILSQILEAECFYSYECSIFPKLSDTGVRMTDEFLKEKENSSFVAPVQRLLNLISYHQLSVFEADDIEINNHFIRMALFDGSRILSNILTVVAKWDKKTPKLWSFSIKPSSAGSCAEEGRVFIKSNFSSTHLGILFELCISVRNNKTGETNLLSPGWAFLKLYDEIGQTIKNGLYSMPVQKGTFYGHHQRQPVFETGTEAEIKSSIFSQHRQSCLTVKIAHLEGLKKEYSRSLPFSLVGAVSMLPFFSLFHQISQDIVSQNVSPEIVALVHCPALIAFIKCVDQPDLMDFLQAEWKDCLKRCQRSEKKNNEFMKKKFQDAIMQSLGCLQSILLPPYDLQNPMTLQARKQQLLHVRELKKLKGSLAIILSPSYQNRSFDVDDVTLDAMGPHAMHRFDTR